MILGVALARCVPYASRELLPEKKAFMHGLNPLTRKRTSCFPSRRSRSLISQIARSKFKLRGARYE